VPFLRWLLRRHRNCGGVTEIRVIAEKPAKMVWSGYFDPAHLGALVEQIRPDPDGPRKKLPFGETPRIGEAQFFFSMQPVNPALLARSAYEFSRCPGTSDADIVQYQLFAVDVDPVRPSGISATRAEKLEALAVARAIAGWFRERGIDCILADSGNGYHLLIPTVAYSDVAAASANAHTLLQLLDKRFSTDQVKVDTTIANPGRILKLYGTKALKGSDLPERPHRFATISMDNVPDDVDLFEIVKGDLGELRPKAALKVAAKGAGTKKPSSAPGGPVGGWDFDTSCEVLRAVLTKAGLEFREKDKDAGRIFAFRDCPHHDDPDGHHFECSVIVRPDGGFAAKCMHDDAASWKESFRPKIGWGEHVGSVLDGLGMARRTTPYEATAQGLVHLRPSSNGPIEVPLTNFTARIVKDVTEDDGAEERRTFEVEAQIHGRSRCFTIPAPAFAGMNWPIEHLGAEAVVYAGQGSKDHARAAVQLLSGEVPTSVGGSVGTSTSTCTPGGPSAATVWSRACTSGWASRSRASCSPSRARARNRRGRSWRV
jgi:hypothetical protein